MRKKTNLKTFWISLSLTLVVLVIIGAAFWGLGYVNQESQANTNLSNQPINFKPSQEQNLNILLMGSDSGEKTPQSYILAKFSATDRKIILTSLPKETISTLNIRTKTLKEHYEYGGAESVCMALESLLDIEVNKHLNVSISSFNTLINLIGGVEFDVKNPIQGIVNIKKGLQTLDGFRISEIIKNTPSKNLEQSKIQGNLIATLINNNFNEKNVKLLDSLYEKMINSIDSNITHYDYIFRKDAFNYIATSDQTKCENIEINGKFDNDKFNLDEASLENIKAKFK